MGRPSADPIVLLAKLFLAAEFCVVACRCAYSLQGNKSWESGSRILNGDIADIKDYPFYGLIVSSRRVYINYANQTSINVHCGSALISPKYFLTASHCFMNNRDPKAWLVIMGLKDRCNSSGRAEKYLVVQVIPHPHVVLAYKIKKNDIAIIKVNRPVQGATPIKLPTSPPRPGETGEAIGFGLIQINKPKGNLTDLPCRLQKVTQMVPDQLVCKSPKENILGAFCVVDADRKNAAACRGDSGGPWIVKNNGEPIIAGVSSFGDILCKVTSHSDHYTDVFRYLSWISDVISDRKRRKAGKREVLNMKPKERKSNELKRW